MNKVLVAGATGKTGYYFLQHCMNNHPADYEFTYLIRSKEKVERLKERYPDIKTIVGSLEDNSLLNSEIRRGGYDIVINIAGIRHSLNVTEAAIDSSCVRWLILVHTTGIYSKYKAAGANYREIEGRIEELLSGTGIALTILRPTMIYGTLDDRNVSVFMKLVYKFRYVPVVNNAYYELQPVWYKDLGVAYYDVILHERTTRNKNYDLSGGKPIMLIDMLKIMGRKLGVKNRFVNIPFGVAYSGAWLLYLLTIGKLDVREKVQRLVEPRVYSYEDAAKDFGYHPVDFEQGVKEEIRMFKEAVIHNSNKSTF